MQYKWTHWWLNSLKVKVHLESSSRPLVDRQQSVGTVGPVCPVLHREGSRSNLPATEHLGSLRPYMEHVALIITHYDGQLVITTTVVSRRLARNLKMIWLSTKQFLCTWSHLLSALSLFKQSPGPSWMIASTRVHACRIQLGITSCLPLHYLLLFLAWFILSKKK